MWLIATVTGRCRETVLTANVFFFLSISSLSWCQYKIVWISSTISGLLCIYSRFAEVNGRERRRVGGVAAD